MAALVELLQIFLRTPRLEKVTARVVASTMSFCTNNLLKTGTTKNAKASSESNWSQFLWAFYSRCSHVIWSARKAHMSEQPQILLHSVSPKKAILVHSNDSDQLEVWAQLQNSVNFYHILKVSYNPLYSIKSNYQLKIIILNWTQESALLFWVGKTHIKDV